MTLEHENMPVEYIVGKDGKKKVVLDVEDFEELLGIVAQHEDLLAMVEGMAHAESCTNDECEECIELKENIESADEDDECCDGDDEDCCEYEYEEEEEETK